MEWKATAPLLPPPGRQEVTEDDAPRPKTPPCRSRPVQKRRISARPCRMLVAAVVSLTANPTAEVSATSRRGPRGAAQEPVVTTIIMTIIIITASMGMASAIYTPKTGKRPRRTAGGAPTLPREGVWAIEKTEGGTRRPRSSSSGGSNTIDDPGIAKALARRTLPEKSREV